ncbi:MAG TPA: amylo-alpha-1,6-glucosidase [Terriglobales bacterium]|nr:amylo-alpha-1,6-glucosidase [Terriglobales bacterium]
MIEFGENITADPDAAASREWLETNGLGGFACSTIIGMNTRRYHALLTAATHPPVGRMVLLSKIEETLIVGDERLELGTNQYPGAAHPQGYRFLKRFRLDPFPVFTYRAGGVELEKSVFMAQGENTVVVEYRLLSKPKRKVDVSLELRPLIAFRDYHSLTHENAALNRDVREDAAGMCSVEPYNGLPRLYFGHDADALTRSGDWYRNFQYAIERERGLDCAEDLFQPFVLTYNLGSRKSVVVIASTEPRAASTSTQLRKKETARRRALSASSPVKDELVEQLLIAADQYIVARGEHRSIIAGYPWFADWGRDTMISLPGIALATGRFDVARDILLEFARHVDQGMLPNRFPDAGEAPEYNTVDATLWFIEAARAYVAYTGDAEFVRKNLYEVFSDIIAWHVRGTRYGIKVDPSGLLAAGEPGVQLTWMDAKVGDWVVTPRYGKPVEIQALWYNALRTLEEFAARFGDQAGQRRYANMATVAQWSFNRLFWNEKKNCLYDVVNGGPPDASVRPNQIFAVSLHHTMLQPDRARRVVEVVERDLLTPLGLRSLSPEDPKYIGRYEGDARARDGAYHQGTVWPWLMGPFVSAYVKAHGRSAAAVARAGDLLQPFREHLRAAGLGQVSEIADADPPHTPRGCFAQAWSVAELLRAAVEDVYAKTTSPAKAAASTATASPAPASAARR